MAKACLWILLALTLGLAGCKTDTGSREFIPNQGWTPVR